MGWHRHDHEEHSWPGENTPRGCDSHGEHQHIVEHLDELNRKVDRIMSDQSRMDADVAAILAEVTTLDTTTTAISDAIAALKVANPGVDFTGLEAATATLTTSVGTLGTLVPPAA